MTLAEDDMLPPQPNGEVVHWMDPGPLRLGGSVVRASAAAAFGLGIAATVAGYFLYRYLEPRREGLPPWRWRRGTTH